MPLTKPLNGNVLIEVIKEDSLVSRADENESLKRGKIVWSSFNTYHITASSFGRIDRSFLDEVSSVYNAGTIVRWEEFADAGQSFEEEGKTYVLIPWYRIIGYEERTNA